MYMYGITMHVVAKMQVLWSDISKEIGFQTALYNVCTCNYKILQSTFKHNKY